MLFWAYLYLLICTITGKIIECFEVPYFIKTISIVFYVIGLLWWTKRQKKYNDLRLNINNNFLSQKMIKLLPLLMLPIVNIAVYGIKLEFCNTVTMLCVAMIEEIFFRGFLQRFFEKKSLAVAIYLTNIIFALLHIINYVLIKDTALMPMQILAAFCVGTCFSVVTMKYDSIIPCIFFHFLINVTGNNDITKINRSLLSICVIMYLFYGCFLWKKKD